MVKNILHFFSNLFSLIFSKSKVPIIKKSYPTYTISGFDLSVIDEINIHRQSKGLSTLKDGRPRCFDIAGSHVEWLNQNTTSKEDFYEKGHHYFNDRAEQIQLEVKCKNVSEVLAYGFIRPKSIVSAWNMSPKHNKILNGNYTHVVVASKNRVTLAIFTN